MKLPEDPTRLEDVEALLLEASRLTNHRHFVVAGSLCALGAVVTPPLDMVLSRDVDLFARLDPGKGAAEMTRTMSIESEFHKVHGVYADPISPGLLSLPEGWESRLLHISFAKGVVGCFIEPNDAAVGKLMRGEENDMRWLSAGVREGIVNLDVVEERLRHTYNALPEDFDNARRNIAKLRGNTSSYPTPR